MDPQLLLGDRLTKARILGFSHQLRRQLGREIEALVARASPFEWRREDSVFSMGEVSEMLIHWRRYELNAGCEKRRIGIYSFKILANDIAPDFSPPNSTCSVYLEKLRWPISGKFASSLFDEIVKKEQAALREVERRAQTLLISLVEDPRRVAKLQWAIVRSEERKSQSFVTIIEGIKVSVSKLRCGSYFEKDVLLYEAVANRKICGREVSVIVSQGNVERVFRVIAASLGQSDRSCGRKKNETP